MSTDSPARCRSVRGSTQASTSGLGTLASRSAPGDGRRRHGRPDRHRVRSCACSRSTGTGHDLYAARPGLERAQQRRCLIPPAGADHRGQLQLYISASHDFIETLVPCRCGYRRHVHRHRAARRRRQRDLEEDLVERRELCAGDRRGAGVGVRGARGGAGRRRRDHARHHGGVERDTGARRRAGGARHQQGLPRRAGAAHPADAPALRPHVGEAPAARGTLPADGGGRTGQRGGRGGAPARARRRPKGGPAAARREGGGDRDLPRQLLREPGPRASLGRGGRGARARSPLLHELRRAAGDQGVRAHLDHGGQHLRAAHRRTVPEDPARRARCARSRRPAAHHAVERRPHAGRGGGGEARQHRRVRTGRGRGGRAGNRAPVGARERHQLRHGRHHRQGVTRRARRVHPYPRVLGGRRHHDRLAAAHRRRVPAERPGHRSRGGRGGRRLDRPHRHRRLDAGRAEERRSPARPGVLRPRRRGPDRHRRQRGARTPEPVVPVRRRAAHRRRRRAAARSRVRSHARSGSRRSTRPGGRGRWRSRT